MHLGPRQVRSEACLLDNDMDRRGLGRRNPVSSMTLAWPGPMLGAMSEATLQPTGIDYYVIAHQCGGELKTALPGCKESENLPRLALLGQPGVVVALCSSTAKYGVTCRITVCLTGAARLFSPLHPHPHPHPQPLYPPNGPRSHPAAAAAAGNVATRPRAADLGKVNEPIGTVLYSVGCGTGTAFPVSCLLLSATKRSMLPPRKIPHQH
ncbi:hypothetical protein B0T24DRAFT_74540 [Lasiosphaeria ovina]|uniref:Uncharacterized protein n=1 Tax=Lasiosphaeria ovina TaxID=92902 RepID=A0AAE0TYL4_9PEZI|nr:hypothetical protein B0T24DRAFT_74540 [Lasiosphaeria ovina]